MSFMFNPLPYDDFTAVNKLSNAKIASANILTDNKAIFQTLAAEIQGNSKSKKIVVLDGYLTADFAHFCAGLREAWTGFDMELHFFDIKEVFKTEEEIQDIRDILQGEENLSKNILSFYF